MSIANAGQRDAGPLAPQPPRAPREALDAAARSRQISIQLATARKDYTLANALFVLVAYSNRTPVIVKSQRQGGFVKRSSQRFVRPLGLATYLACSVPADCAAQALLTCPVATTLDALATCISNQMPRASSNLYVPPRADEQVDFAAVVTQMMNGQCDFDLPASLAVNYQVRTFGDAVTGKSYCLLMEVLDADGDGYVDKGWGTFIVNNNAARPNLNQSAPHPRFDSTTENQAINIFQDTDSRSYLMCGAHRHANGSTGGSCEANYGEADCAHQDNTMFHAAVVALDQFYGAAMWTHIQWHGNVTCPADLMDVFGSQGFDATQPADSNVVSLRDLMAIDQPAFRFQLTGPDAGCNLNGTENVQGRYLNRADNICLSNAGGTPTNKFVHLEQSLNIRRAGAAVWDPSVGQNWPIP